MRNSIRPTTERRGWSFSDLGIRLLLLILAAVLLMALQVTGQLTPIQSFIASLTAPAQVGATGVADNSAGAVDFLLDVRDLRQSNLELEARNEGLLSENFALREVEQENQRLRQLLNFAQTRPGLELRGAQIVGRVIGQESNNFLEYLNLDLGARHGIEVGMPVVTDQGLVGRISEVNNAFSKVLLITDSSSAVNAILQSSRVDGVVSGNPGGNLLMDYLLQGTQLAPGEIVLTSGIGGKFPKGIPIGQVVEINQRDIDVFQQAVIRPTVNFSSLELVAVVTNFDPLEVLPESQQLPSNLPADNITAPQAPDEVNVTDGPAENVEEVPTP
jgi:rod shape-determining protein MreC